MNKEKVIVLLDENSKTIIKTGISTMSLNGIIFITSLAEINQEITADTKKVVILEGYLTLSNSISDLRLYKEIFELQYYYLGSDERWLGVMKDFAVCFRCDIALLDESLIQAALFQDVSMEGENVSISDSSAVVLARSVLKDTAKESDKAVKLASALLSVLDRESVVNQVLEEKEEQLKTLENQFLYLQKLKDVVLKDYKKVIQSSIGLNKSLQQYEISITRNIYQKINLHAYGNRPSIIYLKEYEELPQVDLLVETLRNVLRLQDQKSVKVLRLYDNSGNRKVDVLPGYYKVIYNKYHVMDVLAEDYLCKTGDYGKILDILLTNKINVDVLIIVDCKDHNDIVLDGVSLQFNLCREVEHARKFGLLPANTILSGDIDVQEHESSDNDHASAMSDAEEDYLYWGPYETSSLSKEEEFAFLSARTVIGRMLTIHRYFEQSV